MSDPDVRRDEETRATTVEHVKLLRNRLEATTKEHILELRSYLVEATAGFSRQVESAGEAAAAVETESIGGKGTGNERWPSELEDVLNSRFTELDRKLNARTSKMEEKIGSLIDERLGALLQKLDAVIGKPAE